MQHSDRFWRGIRNEYRISMTKLRAGTMFYDNRHYDLTVPLREVAFHYKGMYNSRSLAPLLLLLLGSAW